MREFQPMVLGEQLENPFSVENMKLGMDIFPIKYDPNIKKDRQQTFDDYLDKMNIYYGGMFHSLNLIGCSYGNMEKSLSVFSIVNFKNNLIRYYPNLKTKIETIIKRYE